MSKNLTTEAGPDQSPTNSEDTREAPNRAKSDEHIVAINHVFALFRHNYHNQFFRAFPEEKDLNITKRLWLDALSRFEAEVLAHGARAIIESSEYLPTLSAMIKQCEKSVSKNLPDAHSAYLEACRAPSPKANFSWSHPIVYFAGKECDWYFLQSSSERVAFPLFQEKFESYLSRVLRGEKFSLPAKTTIEQKKPKALDKEDNQRKLASLRDSLFS